MSGRDIMIQRYASVHWPAIMGQVPFIVTGPRFTAHTTTPRLTGYKWSFRTDFVREIAAIGETGDELSRLITAELLLREGIVEALWVVNGARVVREELRWAASIAQLAAEIPAADPLAHWVLELLSGMSDPSHYHGLLSESDVELQALQIPPEP